MSNHITEADCEKFEQNLDEQLTGSWATGNLETELRMAVSAIRDMPNIPKDYAVQPLLKLINSQITTVLERLEAGLNEQIAASNENIEYHKKNTKNERLIKEWAGGISAMELFILPLIEEEREKL